MQMQTAASLRAECIASVISDLNPLGLALGIWIKLPG